MTLKFKGGLKAMEPLFRPEDAEIDMGEIEKHFDAFIKALDGTTGIFFSDGGKVCVTVDNVDP